MKGFPFAVIAEDGNLLPYVRHELAPILSAGKTYDALVSPASEGYYSLYDRRLGQLNGQMYSGAVTDVGGSVVMLAAWDSAVKNCNPRKGDVDGDDQLSLNDALYILRSIVGLPLPSGITIANGDVAPLSVPSGLPCGGADIIGGPTLTLADAILVVQKAVGFNPY